MFITQSYFSVPKDVRLNSTHYLIMKINSRRELQNIAINLLYTLCRSSQNRYNQYLHIDHNDFVKIYRECTKEPYSFLSIDTTLTSK